VGDLVMIDEKMGELRHDDHGLGGGTWDRATPPHARVQLAGSPPA
jgi:hypothetical protein